MTEGYSSPYTESQGGSLDDKGNPVRRELRAAFGTAPRRSPRLSREDVFEAADGLLFQSVRVTIDRVRQQLGRGSPNTIQEHLEGWWSELGSRIRDISARKSPQLPQELSAQELKLWNTALDTSRKAF